MNYRILGLSGLRVSSVGLGCMGMSHAYGAPADRKEMADLIRTGKILHWGISEPDVEYLRRAHKVCPVTAIQSRYSMMARWNESIFPALEELGIGFVAFSPLANGLLTRCYSENDRFDPVADYRAYMPQLRKESFGQNKDLFSLLDGLAEQKHATPAQISLAWMLCKKPYLVPIPGAALAVPLDGHGHGGALVRQKGQLAVDPAHRTHQVVLFFQDRQDLKVICHFNKGQQVG